jgi:hypothetical protein
MHILYLCSLLALPLLFDPSAEGHSYPSIPSVTTSAAPNQTGLQSQPIPNNPKPFKRSTNAQLLLKSKTNASACYIDIKKWSHSKPENHPSAEFVFQFKTAPIQALLICEKQPTPLLIFRDSVIVNARSVVSDLIVSYEEYRTVNGQQVLLLEMSGNLDHYPITYWGYLASNSSGCTQWLAFGTTPVMTENKSDIESLMNGLVKQ